MKATIQTGKRLVWTTVLAFAVGVCVVFAVGSNVARSLSADRVAEVLADAMPASALDACRAGRPVRVRLKPEVTFDFYDASGAPLNAEASPIDRVLLERLSPALRSAGRFDARDRNAHGVVRLDGAGICAVAQATWRFDGRSVVPFMAWTGASVAVVALALAVLVATFVARPLLLRLRDLRLAAREVGTAAFRPAPMWPDEAGDISRALLQAHERIVDDARRLAGRAASLEWVLASVAHDVRTPLASLQFAIDELAEALPEDALPTLRRALNDVIYMRSLTNNLRLASALQAGEWAPAATGAVVSWSDIAGRVVERAQPFALRRGIDLLHAIEPEVVVCGDETGSEQALMNLVENAIAHADAGTRVTVVARREGACAELMVEDDGAGGVREEQLARLGGSAPDGTREPGHRPAGLGLAITRQICDRSGFRICFERVEPRGLRVTIVAEAQGQGERA